MKRIIFVLSLLVLIVACKQEAPPPPEPKPQEVVVVEVVSKDTPVSFEFVGKTASSRKVEIRSRVEGFLEKRHYTEGSFIEEGDVLYQMDKKPFEAALNASKAELAQQEARLQTSTANLNRVRPLVKKKAVAQKELDDALGNYRASAASVEVAKANVIQAELNLGYTTIYSPVAGLSSYSLQQEGAYIGIGQQGLLTYVAQLDPMWVEFSVSENQMLKAHSSEKNGSVKLPKDKDFDVEVVLADGTSYPQKGRITFSDASLSDETGTFLMRAEIPNKQSELRPGQFVTAKIHGAIKPNAILVPKVAVQQGAKGSFVWVMDAQNKAEYRPISVGRWKDDSWFVESGLRSGDKVVVNGMMRLRPGVPVKAVPAKKDKPQSKPSA